MSRDLEEEITNLEDYTNDLHERYNEKNTELAKVKKQLAIAVEALKKGVSLSCPYFPVKSCKTDMFSALKTIQKELGKALQQIKELNK